MAVVLMMPIRVLLAIVFLLSGAGQAAAQDDAASARKQARAVRVADDAVRVDGRLDDEGWRSAPVLTDFVQREPNEGAPPTDRMEVRFAYDDAALYVGARLFSSAPLQAPMGRRDEADQAEHFLVSLDTYLDRRTAYTFGVTAAGVRMDEYYPSDNWWDGDETFNPVWLARTSTDAEGWTAELRIPFSQLRFNDRAPQIWGLNMKRWVPSRNEETYWAPVRRTDERWASLFGDLHGLDGIRPRRRVELLPYVGGSSRLIGDPRPGDPFSDGANIDGGVGADVKVGIGSNLTLEATVNPDFGQVEADPAEVNLSAFETFFAERRPFFLEGANLLTGNVNNYFYSRRIGAAPDDDVDAEYADIPRVTTILGAAKLTGRLAGGTSIGILGAITDDESARTFDGTLFGRFRVAPQTTYGVGRVTQEIGSEGSTVALMATGVHRQFSADDPLASFLTRKAFTLSGDSVLRFGDYEAQAYLGVTHVDGSPDAILRLQRSSARYFQRPDVRYVSLDPLRTSMSGAKGGFSIERQNARHWTWEADASFETPEFETNDIGRLTTGDGAQVNAEIEYQETTPGRWYRQYSFTLGQGNEWSFGGDLQSSSVTGEAAFTWPNFWETELATTVERRTQNLRLTRGGPSMEQPRWLRNTLEIQSSDASQTRANIVLTYDRSEDGGLVLETMAGITVRPAPQWELSIRPSYNREVDTQQFVTALGGGGAATFGRRYVFGHIDRSEWAAEIRANYTFKPDLNLDFYGEPFSASGQYDSFGELAAARSRLLLPVDAAVVGDRDFNVRSFRSNLVLRWEYRPGSTLYLVWQQDRETERDLRERASLGGLFRSLGASGDNYFAVKASFWISPR